MKKETHAKLTKWLHGASLVVFVTLFLWNWFGPTFSTDPQQLHDNLTNVNQMLLITFLVLALNYLLKLFKK